ncbi:hypothetical protein IL306_011505 [Fusarium sp. DS 682]|nr:hypothetical protein IL306_011505 [Fusarium sp. DS 682]
MKHRAQNVLTATDKKAHGRRRRLLSHGLSDSSTRKFEGTIKEHVDRFCDQIRPDSSDASMKWSKSFDLSRWASYLTFDIMADVVFGQQYELLKHDEHRYVVDSIETSNIRTGVLLQSPEVSTWRLDRKLFPNSIQSRNKFIKFVSRLVRDRMTPSSLRRNDIINYLLTARDEKENEAFTQNEVAAESTTLVVAGTDTSSTAIAATLFYLSQHPSLFRRAAEEIRSAFAATHDVKLGPVLNGCIFTRACIEESMRMSPPAGSALWRQVLKGGQTVDGQFIPSGCDVGVCIYAIHHNDAYFLDPFDFKPDRWLPAAPGECDQAALKLARLAYNPFSVGPRSCIGKGLAMAELMLSVATILLKFDIRRSPGSEGRLGQGHEDAEDGRKRVDEFQLYDHVTAYKQGPVLQFKCHNPSQQLE